MDKDPQCLPDELTRRHNRIPIYAASRTLSEVGWKNKYESASESGRANELVTGRMIHERVTKLAKRWNC